MFFAPPEARFCAAWRLAVPALALLVASACDQHITAEPEAIPFVTPLAVQQDTGTILEGLGCGGVSWACTVDGLQVIGNKVNGITQWTPCYLLPGGCLNIPGPTVFGDLMWGPEPAVAAPQYRFNARLPFRDQRGDIDIARRDITCPQLNSLVRDMLTDNQIWIGRDGMTPVAGEYDPRHGDLSGTNHRGTIYLNAEIIWECDEEAKFCYLNKTIKELAIYLAHEAAHAWFGEPNTVQWQQHEKIHQLAHDCVS